MRARGHLGLIATGAGFLAVALLVAAGDDQPFRPSAAVQAGIAGAFALWAALAAGLSK